jgi:hypothetical protein
MIRRIALAGAAAVLAAVLAAAHAGAQAERQLKLRPADGKLDEEFTIVGSVRELSDGRVLITDPREGRVIVADFKAGTFDPVGRKGQGPGEYANAVPIYAITGDSSIMLDPLSRRWSIFVGSKIVGVLPPDTPVILAMRYAMGADQLGFIWRTDGPATARGTRDYGPSDSSLVIRGNRATGKVDTIARLRVAPSRTTAQTNDKGEVTSMWVSRPAYAVGEEAILFRDGWFAFTRLDPYRVDWRSADGKVTKGAALPVRSIKFDAREREAFEKRNAKNVEDMKKNARNPDMLKDLLRMFTDFPATYPPYVAGALLASRDGQLLARRPITVDFPDWRYDVVDRRGQLVGVLMMAKGERIVGFGEKSVYVVTKDDDDIERIRRHPWP